MEERKVISLLAPGVDEEEMAKKADLVDGKVPASQLPSYVDDVVEYENVEAFPEAGEQGKIYVALDSGFTYRWSGSEYVQIGGQDLSDYYTKEEADQLLDTKQSVGDYATNTALAEGLATKQPVGDYATNTALTEGLATKADQSDVDKIVGFDGELHIAYSNHIYLSQADCDLLNNLPDNSWGWFKNRGNTGEGSRPEFVIAQVYNNKLSLFIYYEDGIDNSYLCRPLYVHWFTNNSVQRPIKPNKGISLTIGEPPLAQYHYNSLQWSVTPTANSTKPVTSGGIYTALQAKQDTITDLDTIRSGATAGATAVQPADVANDIEVVPYQNQTPLTAEQLAKAERGELAILNNNLVHTKFTQDGNVVSFQALEHMAAVGTYTPGYNVRMRRYTITLDRATRMLNDGAGYQQGISISDTDANFLASGETPVADGKRVIREMNMPGTLSDADIELVWDLPEKGDIISFDAYGDGVQRQFRILKNEGLVATLMSLDHTFKYNFTNTTEQTTFDNNEQYWKYADSALDYATNTVYYNALSSSVKAAIVPTDVVQSCYQSLVSLPSEGEGFGTYMPTTTRPDYYKKYAQTTVGVRNCFGLDLTLFADYMNVHDYSVLELSDIREMLLGSDSVRYPYFNIMTACANMPWDPYHFYASTEASILGSGLITEDRILLAVFRIDLSKIQFTRE